MEDFFLLMLLKSLINVTVCTSCMMLMGWLCRSRSCVGWLCQDLSCCVCVILWPVVCHVSLFSLVCCEHMAVMLFFVPGALLSIV